MALAFVFSNSLKSERTQNRIIFGVLIMITVVRSVALVVTPLDLGVDEAQYWLWSQTPDFGYFTKPPLIAWIIAVAHWLFGHHTWSVRLPACWIHLGTALLLWQASTWLFSQRAGRLAALIWITLPATALGSFLISTDTPLLALWSAGLLAMCGVVSGRIAAELGMTLAGLAFGLAMLAKFAGIYALTGLILIMLHGYVSQRKWFAWQHFILAVIAFSVAASPNIIWNFANDFATIRHLGDNANIHQYPASLTGVWHFFGSQFVVAGPLMFGIMLVAALGACRDHRTAWLVWMWVPVFTLMTVQSYLSEANANWAMTAFPALTLIAAGWLDKNKKTHFKVAAVVVNVCISVFIFLVAVAGDMGPTTLQSDPLRKLRGWQQLADDIRPHLVEHEARVVIADRRATASLLSWHFFETDLSILVHDYDGVPSNHFEAKHNWTPQPGRRLIALTGGEMPPQIPGIIWVSSKGKSDVKTSQNRQRQFYIHRGVE